MAQDNTTWNKNKQSINIPLIADVAKTATVTSETTGIGGFELTIREDESIKLENSITDYYAEDNSSLQDNIALKPLTFTINGIVAEKYQDVRVSSSIAGQYMSVLAPALQLVPDIGSFLLEKAFVIEAMIGELMSTINTGLDVINEMLKPENDSGEEQQQENQSEPTNQQKAFIFFYSAYKSRELFEVALPWCTINNCAIESVEMTQPASTRMLSTLKITFKQMNFASTESTVGGSSIGRRNAQASKTPATNLSNVSDTGTDSGNSAGFEATKIN